jgi:hypothetical protein
LNFKIAISHPYPLISQSNAQARLSCKHLHLIFVSDVFSGRGEQAISFMNYEKKIYRRDWQTTNQFNTSESAILLEDMSLLFLPDWVQNQKYKVPNTATTKPNRKDFFEIKYEI